MASGSISGSGSSQSGDFRQLGDGAAEAYGALLRQRGEPGCKIGWCQQGHGLRLGREPADMGDVCLAATERGGERERRRDQAGDLAGEEGDDEIRPGFGDDCDAFACGEAAAEQMAGQRPGLVPQLRVAERFGEVALGGIEVEAGLPLRCVVQRVEDGREGAEVLGNAAGCGGGGLMNGGGLKHCGAKLVCGLQCAGGGHAACRAQGEAK